MGNYKYVAFISYQRSDEEWAKWFHHQLEYYHLPTDLYVEENEEPIKSLRPIFLDEAELAGGNLDNAIKSALNDSLYLIVICSPCSAKSDWVNKEVQDFIDSGRINNVIPVIVDGIPYSKDPETECFVPALCKLEKTKMELRGINVKVGKEMSSVKVVSQILGVAFDSLWNRYEREKEQERNRLIEEKRRLQRLEARYLAEKGREAIAVGNSCMARKLALRILPENIYDGDDRPFVWEAADMLIESLQKNDFIIQAEYLKSCKCVDFSPQKNILAICGNSAKAVVLLDVATGIPIKQLSCGSFVRTAGFSPHGNRIAAIGYDELMYIFNLEDDSVRSIGYDTSEICCTGEDDEPNYSLESLAWSTCGRYLGYVVNDFSDDKYLIALYDITQGVELWRSVGQDDRINCLTFTPDSKVIVSCSDDGTIKSWNTETGELRKIIVEVKSRVRSVRINSEGNRLMAALANGRVVIWKINSQEQPLVIKAHKGQVFVAKFSNDEKKILTSSNDRTTKLWDLETGECIRTICHESIVRSASFSYDGRYIASTDGIVKVVDLEGNNPFNKKVFQPEGCLEIVPFLFSHDSESLYFASDTRRSDDIEFYKWDMKSDACKKYVIKSKKVEPDMDNKRDKLLQLLTGAVVGFHEIEETGCLLIDVWNEGVYVYDVWNEHIVKKFDYREYVYITQRNDDIIAKNNAGDIKAIDKKTYEEIKLFNVYEMYKEHCSVVGGNNGHLYVERRSDHGSNPIRFDILDLGSKELVKSIPLPIEYKHFGNVCFSEDEKLMLLTNGNRVMVWDTDCKVIVTEVVDKQFVKVAIFSNDNKLLIYASGSSINILDIRTGQKLQTIVCHNGNVAKMSFSRDGKKFASTAWDKTVCVMDFIDLQDVINKVRECYRGSDLLELERRAFYLD